MLDEITPKCPGEHAGWVQEQQSHLLLCRTQRLQVCSLKIISKECTPLLDISRPCSHLVRTPECTSTHGVRATQETPPAWHLPGMRAGYAQVLSLGVPLGHTHPLPVSKTLFSLGMFLQIHCGSRVSVDSGPRQPPL